MSTAHVPTSTTAASKGRKKWLAPLMVLVLAWAYLQTYADISSSSTLYPQALGFTLPPALRYAPWFIFGAGLSAWFLLKRRFPRASIPLALCIGLAGSMYTQHATERWSASTIEQIPTTRFLSDTERSRIDSLSIPYVEASRSREGNTIVFKRNHPQRASLLALLQDCGLLRNSN